MLDHEPDTNDNPSSGRSVRRPITTGEARGAPHPLAAVDARRPDRPVRPR